MLLCVFLDTYSSYNQADEIEKILVKKFMGFMMRRAETFMVMRRKAIKVF